MKKPDNKRKYRRFNCLVPVEGSKKTGFDGSQTTDISKGGIGFISSVRVPLNKKIAIEIALDPDGESVLVVGKVKWVTEVPETGSYRVGMQFDDFLSGSSSRIQQYFNV